MVRCGWLAVWFAVWFAVWVLVATPAAGNTDRSAVETRFQQAVKTALVHRQAGHHEQALAALDSALLAIRDASGARFDQGRSRVRYYKALTLEALGRLVEAEALLAVLDTAAGLTDVERAEVAKRLVAVRSRLAEEKAKAPGTLTIITLDAEGASVTAQVSVDGGSAKATPVTVTLAPGGHRLKVWGPAVVSTEQAFEVAPGSRGRLVVRVRILRETVMTEPVFDPPAGAWAVLGSGLGLVVAGAALHAAGFAEVDGAKSAATRQVGLQQEARGQRMAYAAYGLYGLGGALAIGGLAWLLVEGWPPLDEGGVTPSVGWTSRATVIGVGGRF